jgi:uncharacterized protein (TIGR02996 family)
MTDDEAFLRAITAEPDEDAHRLVYADWLDEHGGPAGAARAELIRIQIEHERLTAGDPRREELRRRCLELLDEHRSAWLARLPKLPGGVWHHFWRGFVGGADVHAWKFYRRHAAALFAAAPVQFLRLCAISTATCRELASSPHLAHLLSLVLVNGSIGDEEAAALAASPWLGNLRRLGLCGPVPICFRPHAPPWVIGDAGALALAASPRLGRLELLNLRGNAVGLEAAQALRERFGKAAVRL